jgi:threonine/homoserine/homoserine lactone efflux protein
MNELMPFLLFSATAMITPGPNNFMIMNSGLNFGIRRSLPHYFGICLGFPIMVLIVALGFGAVFLKYLWLKQILKIAGAGYMLYLSWKIASSAVNTKINFTANPLNFIQATLFQLVNPKALLMTIAAISIFSITSNYFHNAIAFSTLFLLVCIPSVGIWLVGGAVLKNFLNDEKYRKWFNITMAICLAASTIMIFFE